MSEKASGRIDPENLDQLVTLGLTALFTAVAIARGDAASTNLALVCAICAKAVVKSVTDAP